MKKQLIIPLFLCLLVFAAFLILQSILGNEDEAMSENSIRTISSQPPDPTSGILSSMSLEEKVGQMFFVRCPIFDEETVTDPAITLVSQWKVGGVLLFADFFEGKTTASAIASISSLQNASDIPLLVGIDEEGGTVVRASKFTAFRETPFQSPQQLYTQGGFHLITQNALEKSVFLKSMGINVNFAPVCDVSSSPSDFIYARSFGKDAGDTAEYARTVVLAMKNIPMGSVLKHFPGYGNNRDTHKEIVIDSRPYETFISSDYLPFIAGIDAGADCVLISHNIVTCLDKDRPASLSPMVNRELREVLQFGGVIITDDLDMAAITDYTGGTEAAVAAVLAGNDLLCTGQWKTQIPAVIKAVESGYISPEQIDASVLRILKWKQKLGLI